MTAPSLADVDVEVDGAALLDELHAALLRYVVFPTVDAGHAVTLWVAATHAQPAWEHAPRLAVISPEKRCGKSRLLDVVEATAHRALVTVNISPAALVRCVSDEDPPTLCIDEADTVFGPKSADNHEDLRGLINSGHQRGRPYIRWDPTTRSPEVCATFSMAMLAGIGDLPDTIMDRAVVVRMRRRAPHETVAPYRTRRDKPALALIRNRLNAWVRGHLDHLTAAEPNMPVEDRAADTWEPLVSVADLAGGHWPQRVRRAVLALLASESATESEASLGVRLLGDVRDIYRDWTVGFLTSQDLTTALCKIEEAPWSEIGYPPGLTAKRLSDLLRPYGIRPVRNAAGTARGYRLEDMTEAFARYLAGDRQDPSTSQNGRSASDGSVSADGSNRQAQGTDSALSRGSDGLTGTDDPPPGSGCACGRPFHPGAYPDCAVRSEPDGRPRKSR